MLKYRYLTIAACVSLLSACEADTGDDGTDDSSIPFPDGGYVYDSSVPRDSGFPSFDGALPFDAAGLFDAFVPSDGAASDAGLDASTDGSVPRDGSTDASTDGSVPRDASSDATTPDASSPDGGSGVCGGATPHGCYTPKAGNPQGCPPRIHEQSAFYPPLEEWEACSSPFYEACVYLKPGGGEANCSCDLGLHWLCTY